MDDYAAEHMRAGPDAVNALLRKRFPVAAARVEQLLAMEATGKWEVKMHRSSDGPDEYDDGAVVDYAG